MTKNALNDLIVRTLCHTAISLDPDVSYEWTYDLLSQLVQVHRIAIPGVKHLPGCRISHRDPTSVQNLC